MKSLKVRTAVLAGIAFCGLPMLADAGHSFQAANLHVFGTDTSIAGAATLYRSAEAVRATISTTGLDRKSAYTVWAIVWNDPALCADACDAADLGVAGSSVFYAAGFVTGTDGSVTVSFQVDAGDLATGSDVRFGPGIEAGNGNDAEIHFLVRSHGKAIPELVDLQISTVGGACAINTCVDQYAVAFPPL